MTTTNDTTSTEAAETAALKRIAEAERDLANADAHLRDIEIVKEWEGYDPALTYNENARACTEALGRDGIQAKRTTVDWYALAEMALRDAAISNIDLDDPGAVEAHMDRFARATADRTGIDKTEVAQKLNIALVVRSLLLDAKENGRKVRDDLIRFSTPLGLMLGGLGLGDTLYLCSGLPFGGSPLDDDPRFLTLRHLTAEHIRLIVFDMASGTDHTDDEVRRAAKTAAAWIHELGDLTYGQWFAVQRDEETGTIPLSSSPARRVSLEERQEIARRAGTTA